ncbi:hypothetical protein PINS_up023221 [Pythium insidiosum]|nr:hypothetical protein PINS_up023221 [Pythium insidiosum]
MPSKFQNAALMMVNDRVLDAVLVVVGVREVGDRRVLVTHSRQIRVRAIAREPPDTEDGRRDDHEQQEGDGAAAKRLRRRERRDREAQREAQAQNGVGRVGDVTKTEIRLCLHDEVRRIDRTGDDTGDHAQ